MQHIPAEKCTQDQLIKIKLSSKTEWEFNYKFQLPDEIPNGVFVLKFQMVDPLIMKQMMNDENDLSPREIVRKSKFGECLNITLQVEGGNGDIKGHS